MTTNWQVLGNGQMRRKYKYFELGEFACKHCGENRINEGFVYFLDVARGFAGVPFKINSGYRCQEHDDAVSGRDSGNHTGGWAADISAPDSHTRFLILKALLRVGFDRIGVYSWGLHVDCNPHNSPEVVWYGT